MQSALDSFNGPYGRYRRAVYEIDNKNAVQSDDIWIVQLKHILNTRKAYKNDYVSFYEGWPLYANLLNIFESTGIGTLRGLIEALLLTGVPLTGCAQFTKEAGLDEFSLGLYKELFFNIDSCKNNIVDMQRYVLIPMLANNSDKLQLDTIWKLLAFCGGLETLVRKGFGTEPLSPEDIDYLLHYGSLRNCSLLMSYISDGAAFVERFPNIQTMLNNITMFELSRNVKDRGIGGLKSIQTIDVGTEMSRALADTIQMIKTIPPMTEDMINISGVYRPELDVCVEECQFTEYVNNDVNNNGSSRSKRIKDFHC